MLPLPEPPKIASKDDFIAGPHLNLKLRFWGFGSPFDRCVVEGFEVVGGMFDPTAIVVDYAKEAPQFGDTVSKSFAGNGK